MAPGDNGRDDASEDKKGDPLRRPALLLVPFAAAVFAFAARGSADDLIASTGSPDGLMAAASRPGITGEFEIEAADDFILQCGATVNSVSFVGLLPTDTTKTVSGVAVEIYSVFPLDSDTVRTINVTTRANSPSDVAFATRDSAASDFSFGTTVLNTSFTASNSVQPGGIHPKPSQTTGGNGAVTGREVQFDLTLTSPISLPAGHYFFVPQVTVSGGGTFYWLSAPNPIVSGTPFNPDLQTWARDANLDPDWSRIGTDIVGGTTPPTFNGSFSLSGTLTPVVLTSSVPSPLVAVAGTPIAPVTFSPSGGTAPYTFGFSAGSVPGLSLDASTGVLSGTPTQLGDFPITIGVTDVSGCNQELNFLVRVQSHPGIPALGGSGLALLLAALAAAGVAALRR